MGDLTIRVNVDKKKKTITVSDAGVGMTREEIEKYINQIAFSSAEEFLEKYKDDTSAIIGHFGLGFYSSFMVADKVEINTRSWKEDADAVKWSCDGSPEYTIEESEEQKISELLDKYCKFLPVEIAFGKEKEWKDGKEIETDKDHIINDTKPLWTIPPAEVKEEQYKEFYQKLYPMAEEPLFNIHLNVDYPFNLTGILYFPRIKSNIEVQRNKIQLYSNQVFVTDSVEGIVPEFLTLLHGVLDSPDIPLNVSRSYLQSDSNVKKISNHIMKKVADRLEEIFKNEREQFEQKWDDLKLFIEYGQPNLRCRRIQKVSITPLMNIKSSLKESRPTKTKTWSTSMPPTRRNSSAISKQLNRRDTMCCSWTDSLIRIFSITWKPNLITAGLPG
jgi:molecular chaperone HtpG